MCGTIERRYEHCTNESEKVALVRKTQKVKSWKELKLEFYVPLDKSLCRYFEEEQLKL